MNIQTLTARPKKRADHTGETIAGWKLLRRESQSDECQAYRGRHTCGAERVVTMVYLRECVRRGTTSCVSCYRKSPKKASERRVVPGAVFGAIRVISPHKDGPNKFCRAWLCECTRCGRMRIVSETSLPPAGAKKTVSCAHCRQKLDRSARYGTIISMIDEGPRATVQVRAIDGRIYTGVIYDVTAAAIPEEASA